MRKRIGIFFWMILIIIAGTAFADVEINESTFPDVRFRNVVTAYDTNYDNRLSDAEIASVRAINCSNKFISSLTGIEYFTALEELNCWYNSITALDLSQNTALKKLNCGYNEITVLNLNRNSLLEELECGQNPLTSLDLWGNPGLKRLYAATVPLTTLDLTSNTELVEVQVCKNVPGLSSLILGHHDQLETLICFGNSLSEIDVSNCPALVHLDVSMNPQLEKLDCSSHQLETLKVSNSNFPCAQQRAR